MGPQKAPRLCCHSGISLLKACHVPHHCLVAPGSSRCRGRTGWQETGGQETACSHSSFLLSFPIFHGSAGHPHPPPPPAAPCSPQTGAGAGFKGTHSGRGAWGGRCKLVSWALGRSHSPSAWPAGERRASSQGDPPLCSCHLEYLQLKQKTNKL